MTKTEYRRALKALGLSVTKAGPFLGITSRQSFRIAAGDAKLPKAAEQLLLVMLRHGITPDGIQAIIMNRRAVLRDGMIVEIKGF